MTDPALVAKKLALVETCLSDLRRLGHPAAIDTDLRERRFVERTLQLAIQAALDVASADRPRRARLASRRSCRVRRGRATSYARRRLKIARCPGEIPSDGVETRELAGYPLGLTGVARTRASGREECCRKPEKC
jgi:hypothetical protein